MKVLTPVVLLVPSNFDCEGRAACSNFFFNLKKWCLPPTPPSPILLGVGPSSPLETLRPGGVRPGKVIRIRASETLNMSSDK